MRWVWFEAVSRSKVSKSSPEILPEVTETQTIEVDLLIALHLYEVLSHQDWYNYEANFERMLRGLGSIFENMVNLM